MIKHIQLGDIEMVLRFKIGMLKHIKDLTGEDPLKVITEAGSDVFGYSSAIINAGIRCQCDATGKEYPDKETIDKQISANMEFSDVQKLTGFLNEFLNTGEAISPVQASE